MKDEVKHLVDVIAAVSLPKKFATEEVQFVGDMLPTKILKKIAKELLKDVS